MTSWHDVYWFPSKILHISELALCKGSSRPGMVAFLPLRTVMLFFSEDSEIKKNSLWGEREKFHLEEPTSHGCSGSHSELSGFMIIFTFAPLLGGTLISAVHLKMDENGGCQKVNAIITHLCLGYTTSVFLPFLWKQVCGGRFFILENWSQFPVAL